MTITAGTATMQQRGRTTQAMFDSETQAMFDSDEMQRLRQQLRERSPVYAHHQIYLALRALLTTGELRPGEQLPTQKRIALFLHITPPTVRQALERLIEEGQLTRRPAAGHLSPSAETRSIVVTARAGRPQP